MAMFDRSLCSLEAVAEKHGGSFIRNAFRIASFGWQIENTFYASRKRRSIQEILGSDGVNDFDINDLDYQVDVYRPEGSSDNFCYKVVF